MFSAIIPVEFELHVEVWVLVLSILAVGIYIGTIMAKQIGEKVTKKNKVAFTLALLALWIASDWPVHDLAEEYLYSAHVVQHLLIVFVAPPLFWIAVPEWFANLVMQRDKDGALPKWVKRLGHPVTAGLTFNGIFAATHIPGVVNFSVSNGPFHYTLHLALFFAAMMMWLPVVSPYKEMRLNPTGKIIYLFLMSVFPTIPAGFLTFARVPIYSAYAFDGRIWDVSAVSDQQAAGVIMKVIGGFYLWTIIAFVFFRWVSVQDKAEKLSIKNRKPAEMPEQSPPAYELDDEDHEQSHDRNLQKSSK